MTEANEVLATAMQELIDANVAARAVMERNEVRLRHAMQNLERGIDAQTAIEMVRPDTPRQSTNDALEAYESARHKLRRTMIAELLAAGMSIGEIGKCWGFSRQLASRYVKEAQTQASG